MSEKIIKFMSREQREKEDYLRKRIAFAKERVKEHQRKQKLKQKGGL